MSEELVGRETEPRDSFAWNIYSKDGRIGVRCVYDKARKELRVERDGMSSSVHEPSIRKARSRARGLANEMFSHDNHYRLLRELSEVVERLKVSGGRR